MLVGKVPTTGFCVLRSQSLFPKIISTVRVVRRIHSGINRDRGVRGQGWSVTLFPVDWERVHHPNVMSSPGVTNPSDLEYVTRHSYGQGTRPSFTMTIGGSDKSCVCRNFSIMNSLLSVTGEYSVRLYVSGNLSVEGWWRSSIFICDLNLSEDKFKV